MSYIKKFFWIQMIRQVKISIQQLSYPQDFTTFKRLRPIKIRPELPGVLPVTPQSLKAIS